MKDFEIVDSISVYCITVLGPMEHHGPWMGKH